MFKNGIPLGKIFGITIRLHASWFFIFFLVTWSLTMAYFPATYPDWSLTLKISAGLLTSFLYFGSVLVHEMSHSLVAIREGIEIKSITLFFLGGVSEMAAEPKTARVEFRMAAAGPASSLILGAFFFGIHLALRGQASLPAQFTAAVSYYLGTINAFLGAFNLVPGFPLDGGRILRSLLWRRSDNLPQATQTASTIGQAFGNLFIFGGLFIVFMGDIFDGVWLSMIGYFLKSTAAGTYSQMLVQDMLKGHTVTEIMSTDCTVVPPEMPLDSFVHDIMLHSGRRCYTVASSDQAMGLITLADVKAIEREEWSRTPVRQAMTPLERLKTVAPGDDLALVLQLLAENDINQVPVVENGQIIGMIARDSIISFISLWSQLN